MNLCGLPPPVPVSLIRLSRTSERGAALFILLLCIVAFVALGFAVTGSMQGTGKNAEAEKAQLAQAQSENCTAQIDNAIIRLKTIKGCSDDEISYELPGGGNENPDAPADNRCHVFFAEGAGALPCGAYADVVACMEDLTVLNIGEEACDVIYAGDSGGKRLYVSNANESSGTAYASSSPIATSPSAASTQDGQANTDALLTIGDTPAAALCDSLGDEWYLPSQDELTQITLNSQQGNLMGTFPNGTYWTSTLLTGSTAQSVVYDAFQGDLNLSYASGAITAANFIRCVRSD